MPRFAVYESPAARQAAYRERHGQEARAAVSVALRHLDAAALAMPIDSTERLALEAVRQALQSLSGSKTLLAQVSGEQRAQRRRLREGLPGSLLDIPKITEHIEEE